MFSSPSPTGEYQQLCVKTRRGGAAEQVLLWTTHTSAPVCCSPAVTETVVWQSWNAIAVSVVCCLAVQKDFALQQLLSRVILATQSDWTVQRALRTCYRSVREDLVQQYRRETAAAQPQAHM
jgi:hypothetical protein